MGCLNKYTKFMRISTVSHTPAIFNFQADCLSILSMVFTLIWDVEFAKVERFVYSLSSCNSTLLPGNKWLFLCHVPSVGWHVASLQIFPTPPTSAHPDTFSCSSSNARIALRNLIQNQGINGCFCATFQTSDGT